MNNIKMTYIILEMMKLLPSNILAETIIELTNSKSKLIHLPPLKEGDMTKRQPDISKMKELLSRNLLPYREGIKKVIESWGK
jgi:UDP-glucuronate decarboxylase